jgi:hypothetical protein
VDDRLDAIYAPQAQVWSDATLVSLLPTSGVGECAGAKTAHYYKEEQSVYKEWLSLPTL